MPQAPVSDSETGAYIYIFKSGKRSCERKLIAGIDIDFDFKLRV